MPSTSSSPRADRIGGGHRADGGPQARRLGRLPYREAWALQKDLVEQRLRGEIGDVLLIVEHEQVITTGRATSGRFLTGGGDGVDVVEVERGGQATWHGPGQIVAYPIVAMAEGHRDLHAWLRALEQAGIETAAAFGVPAGRRDGATGVWVGGGQRKLASIGVAARRWVTYHGMAFNHDPDLSRFETIVPCGFDAAVMTSLVREVAHGAGPDRMAAASEVAVPERVAVEDALIENLQRHLAPFAT